MNCERCGQGPAQIQYTEVREGQKTKLRICGDCAAEPRDPTRMATVEKNLSATRMNHLVSVRCGV